jgi:RNA polymerase sigma factor (sigma-70 family)
MKSCMSVDSVQFFEVLAREHESMLVAYLLSLMSDRAAAEDAAQETLVRAYRSMGTLKASEKFAPWLRGIARHVAYDHIAKTGRVLAHQTVNGLEAVYLRMESASETADWHERLLLVEQCFEQLPEGMKSICQAHYYEGLKAREIVERLGLALATILKRLERSRVALRECVKSKLEEQTA